jgi:hypothetical protein
MTQADSVHSTPRNTASKINPPDPTRRHLLTIAVAGAVAAAVPAAALAAASADPIYAAIGVHRQAYSAMQATFAEHKRAHDLADATVGSYQIEVPSMVEPGKTVLASCWWNIERAIPSKQYPDLYQCYRGALEERTGRARGHYRTADWRRR